MVQSETFVSRRKKRAERRAPRKLFTARGLVGNETQDTDQISPSHSKENDITLGDEPGANNSKTQLEWLNKEKIRRDCEMISRCDERLDQISHSDSFESEGEEVSSNSSTGDSLDDVMQVGCMDSLFFSGAINRTRPSIPPPKHDKSRVEAFMTLPLSPLNFMKQADIVSFIPRDETNFRGRLDCRLPYQHASDQIAGTQLFTAIRGKYFGFDRQSKRSPQKINYPLTDGERKGDGELKSTPSNQQRINFPIFSIESPPSQIFIGEQPCLSDELIPVDDIPSPGVHCDLRKYHPKPLTLRQNYAFGKPMLSIDSEESDAISEVPGEKNESDRSTLRCPADEKKVLTPPSDEKSYPSFDEADPCTLDMDTMDNMRESVIVESDLEIARVCNYSETGADLPACIDEKNRSVVTGCGSIAGSAATDQAITSEEPKKMRSKEFKELECAFNFSGDGAESKKESLTQQTAGNILLSKTKSLSIDDDNVSNVYIQDENNSPPHMTLLVKNAGHGKSDEETSVSQPQKLTVCNHARGFQTPSFQVKSMTEVRRKPFELMVAANLQNSPGAYFDDEFFSPKANSPKNREARRFRFEDSFDECEFFDTIAET